MDVKAILKKSGSIIGLIVLFVVISCLNSSFIDPSNLKNLLRQVSINALISFMVLYLLNVCPSCLYPCSKNGYLSVIALNSRCSLSVREGFSFKSQKRLR